MEHLNLRSSVKVHLCCFRKFFWRDLHPHLVQLLYLTLKFAWVFSWDRLFLLALWCVEVDLLRVFFCFWFDVSAEVLVSHEFCLVLFDNLGVSCKSDEFNNVKLILKQMESFTMGQSKVVAYIGCWETINRVNNVMCCQLRKWFEAFRADWAFVLHFR